MLVSGTRLAEPPIASLSWFAERIAGGGQCIPPASTSDIIVPIVVSQRFGGGELPPDIVLSLEIAERYGEVMGGM